jgi:hypothetical protein
LPGFHIHSERGCDPMRVNCLFPPEPGFNRGLDVCMSGAYQ